MSPDTVLHSRGNDRPARNLAGGVAEADATRLAAAVHPLVDAHPGLSGVVSLRRGLDAFATRMALVDAAQSSLDLQYYIWHNDLTGALLFDAVRRAADRGVRVRLLLDDNNTADLDEVLRLLDDHPGIEVRLFNPFRHRRWRAVDYLTDFARVNRRMHNKSFTVDKQVTVIGGRNVGDEYFGAAAGMLFVDLDVLTIGPAVAQVCSDFERYWESESAFPLGRVLPARGTGNASAPPATAGSSEASERAATYRRAVAQSTYMDDLQSGRHPFEWARIDVVSDDPFKVLGRAASADYLWPRLRSLMPAATREVQLVSPYLVPGATGGAFLCDLAHRGVQVSILTNSLAATDVPAVHSGYARWRNRLITAGVHLFELKAASAPPPVRHKVLGGSSASSLHAKTFVVDRSAVFVGSFNFDPRSARLNTELGFVIHSAALAASVADGFAERVRTLAYTVQRTGSSLRWVERRPDGERMYTKEPHAGFWRRLGVSLLSLLPIERLL